MAEFILKVLDQENKMIAQNHGEGEVTLFCQREFCPGDKFILESSEKDILIWLQFDDALGKSLTYITGKVCYEIPFGEKRLNLSPKAFSGNKHLLTVKDAKEFEYKTYHNQAVNVYDKHGTVSCYPHASANVETRGESVFAAKNAIDGITINDSHGNWPYASWGINKQDDAAIKVEFGRTVEIDCVLLYTRADFPHDNWWKSVTLTFSNGKSIISELDKSDHPHEIRFEKMQINWVQLSKLIKSEDPSPFPALTQIEVYGTDIS